MYYFWFGPLLSPKDQKLYGMVCGLMSVPLFIVFAASFAAYPQVYIFGNNLFLLSVSIWLGSNLWCDKFLLRYILENNGTTLFMDWKWVPAQWDINTAKAVFQSAANINLVMIILEMRRSVPFDFFFILILILNFTIFFLYFAHTVQALRKDGFINKNKFYPWHFINRYSWKQIGGIDFLVLYLEKTDNLRPVSREEITFKMPIDKIEEVRTILAGKIEVAPQTETGGAFSHAAQN